MSKSTTNIFLRRDFTALLYNAGLSRALFVKELLQQSSEFSAYITVNCFLTGEKNNIIIIIIKMIV